MTDPDTIARSYLALWNDPDPASRVARLGRDWAAQARYADPMMQAEGREAVAAMIAATREQFAGMVFSPTGRVDGHGPFVRFSWALGPAGGAPVAGGTDVVRLDADGRIAEVIGFLDGVPG